MTMGEQYAKRAHEFGLINDPSNFQLLLELLSELQLCGDRKRIVSLCRQINSLIIRKSSANIAKDLDDDAQIVLTRDNLIAISELGFQLLNPSRFSQ